jgi:hypothetical protein
MEVPIKRKEMGGPIHRPAIKDRNDLKPSKTVSYFYSLGYQAA